MRGRSSGEHNNKKIASQNKEDTRVHYTVLTQHTSNPPTTHIRVAAHYRLNSGHDVPDTQQT